MRPKSLTLILLFVALSVLLTESGNAQKKSPAMAGLMSVALPGSGQFYTKQPNKGLTVAGVYLGAMALVVGYGPWTWEDKSTGEFSDLNPGTSSSTKLIWYGSAAVAGGALIYSVVDAIGAAKRINKANLAVLPYFRHGASGLQIAFNIGR